MCGVVAFGQIFNHIPAATAINILGRFHALRLRKNNSVQTVEATPHGKGDAATD